MQVRVLARDPALLVAVGLMVLACWLPRLVSPSAGVLLASLPAPFFDMMVVLASWQLARSPGIIAAARRFWWAVAVMGAFFVVADGGQIVFVLAHPGRTDPIVSDWMTVWTLTGLAVTVLVMLTYPQVASSPQTRIRFWLDAAAVLSAAVVLIWVLAGRSPAHTVPQTAVALIGGFAATRLLLSGAAPMCMAAAVPVLGSAAVQCVIGVLSSDPDGNRVLLLPLQVASAGLIGMGLRVQLLMTRHPGSRPARSARPFSLLPYAMLAAMFGLLPVALPHTLSGLAVVSLTGLAVVTGLVVARQLIVFGEFDTLVARLDASLLEARELEDRLRHQTLHDPLTGLANRALFGERLAVAAPAGAAVLNIDLNGFKTINDTCGHHAGDAVLVEVAARLRASVPAEGLAARLGGDEFAVLLPGTDKAAADAVAERFQALLWLPVPVDGRPLRVGASIGLVTGVADDPEVLMRLADEEMYRVKRAGRRYGDPAPPRSVLADLAGQ